MSPVKHVLCPMIVIVTILTTLAAAQVTPASRLALFKELVDAVGAAGDAIAKVTDGIAHLVETGNEGWSYISAHNTYSRLIDVSARATNLAGNRQVAVVNSIDEYLAKQNPSAYDWDTVRSAIGKVVVEVKALLDHLNSERSDFVREDAYSTLVQTLAARTSLLDRLATLPQPTTPEERAALGEINERYKQLLANFREAIKELNEYLKVAKPE